MELQGATTTTVITDDLIAALQQRHKTKDVRSEVLKMHLYLTRYPKRRPVMIWRFVDNWLKRSPATVRPLTVVNAWWTTDERTINQGAALGVNARPGETMAQLRDRISKAMQAAA